jgi:hypothetical protein
MGQRKRVSEKKTLHVVFEYFIQKEATGLKTGPHRSLARGEGRGHNL